MPDDEQKPDDSPPEATSERSSQEPRPEEAFAPGSDVAHEDKFRPEAIAARVDRLGEETNSDRVAREEEAKLLARKKQNKEQKKRGLESAASKRLSRIGEAKVKRPSALTGPLSPGADPLLARAARLGSWIQKHQGMFAGIVAVAVLGAIGTATFVYWQDQRSGAASTLLAQALSDQRGHIADTAETTSSDDDEDSKAKPLFPTFKSVEDRREAALAKYRAVESKYGGTGAAILARLSEGSLLLDKGDAKGAISAYEDVRTSALGKADGEVRGRALEGVGFADELLAKTDAPERAKHLDDALAAYKRLEEIDTTGFKELGMYHQTRVLQAQGSTAKAIELLKDLQKRVSEPGDDHPFSYLRFVVEDRLRDLDPSALPAKPPEASVGGQAAGAGGGPGGHPVDMNDPQIKKLLEQLRKKSGAVPPPVGPPQ